MVRLKPTCKETACCLIKADTVAHCLIFIHKSVGEGLLVMGEIKRGGRYEPRVWVTH